jgi:superfamily II DNA/RNA helicase
MLPAIVHILNTKQSGSKGTPKILVLAPTRELALQIEEHTQKVLFDKLTTLCIYGGASRSGQIQSLKSKVDIGKFVNNLKKSDWNSWTYD